MSCSICFEDITATTGHVQLSCSHTFHYSCLTRWFSSQVLKELPETCPCCRHETNAHEGLPDDEEEEEEVDDASSISSEDTLIMDIDDAFRASVAAEHFAAKRAALSEEDFALYAITRIQAAMRAYRHRMNWIKYKMVLDERKALERRMNDLAKYRKDLEVELSFVRSSMQMPRSKWLECCATRIQALWRGFHARRVATEEAYDAKRISWTFAKGVWKRSFLRHVESWTEDKGMAPQSLAFQKYLLENRSAAKIQAGWHGYAVRRAMRSYTEKAPVTFTHHILDIVLIHLGGRYLSCREFNQLPSHSMDKAAFTALCAKMGARRPSEIDWRQASSACGWIPASFKEHMDEVEGTRNIIVPRISYSGIASGWSAHYRYNRREKCVKAAVKLQSVWRGWLCRKQHYSSVLRRVDWSEFTGMMIHIGLNTSL